VCHASVIRAKTKPKARATNPKDVSNDGNKERPPLVREALRKEKTHSGTGDTRSSNRNLMLDP